MNKSFIILLVLSLALVSCAYATIDPAYIAFDTGDITLAGTAGVIGNDLNASGWTYGAGAARYTNFAYNGSIGINMTLNLAIYNVTANDERVNNRTYEAMFYDDGTDTGIFITAMILNRANAISVCNQGAAKGVYSYSVCGAYSDFQMPISKGWHKSYINQRLIGEHILCISNETHTECIEDNSVCNATYTFEINNQQGNATYDNLFVYYGNVTPPYPTLAGSGGTVGGTINLSIASPANNTQFSTSNMFFNLSGNFTYATNCSLYLDNVNNQTKQNNAGYEIPINFSLSVADGTHHYYINCTDNTTNVSSANNLFYIDTVFPNLITGFINRSLYTQNQNVTAWFNFTDETILHSVNITIDNYYVYFNDTLTESTFNYSLNRNINFSTSTDHHMMVKYADGHTANSLLSSYGVEYPVFLYNALHFNFNYPYKYGWTKISSSNILDSFTTEQKADRYIIKYDPIIQGKTYTFEVESSFPIKIINRPDTNYKTWLVFGEHWMDFIIPNAPNAITKITRINSKKVSVEISGLTGNEKDITFNSIGDLNIVTVNYVFYTFNITETYRSPVLEYSVNPFTLNISFNNVSVSDIAASFIYNNTYNTASKTTNTNYIYFSSNVITDSVSALRENRTFYWNYNITGNTNITTNTSFLNQTIYKLFIDNCTNVTFRSLNVTFRDQTTLGSILANYSVAWTIWSDNPANKRNNSYSFLDTSNTTYCINVPDNTFNYTTDAIFSITSGGYTPKIFYLNDHTLTENKTLDIYLLSIAETTAVTVTVLDENDLKVTGAFVELQKYDVATMTYTTLDYLPTDSNGQVVLLSMVLNTVFYRFSVDYNGVRYLTTEPAKQATNTKTLKINIGSSALAEYQALYGLSGTLTFSNTTKEFLFTYVGNSKVLTGCLEAVNTTFISGVLINSSCVNANSSSIPVRIGENPAGRFIATGYVLLDDGQKIVLKTLEVLQGNNRFPFGKEYGAFIAIIWIGTLALVGIASPIMAILLCLLGLGTAILMNLLYLELTSIIAIVVLGIYFIIRLRNQ